MTDSNFWKQYDPETGKPNCVLFLQAVLRNLDRRGLPQKKGTEA